MTARDPRRDPKPGDVFVFDSGVMTLKHMVERVTRHGPGTERRVTFHGQAPITLREFRKLTAGSDVTVEAGFDVEAVAKAIAGNLLMANLHVEDLYPRHGDAIRLAMRRLGRELLDEAGDAAKQPMGFRLRPVGHDRAEVQLGDPLLMGDRS
jgi:hypothetical protein